METIEPADVTWRRALTLRCTAVAIIMTLLAVVPASGQAQASSEYPYGLDPYKPSDATLLRNYGDTLVAQTPLSELQKLDPYKPSHAALLRELGGAFPLWGLVWYPAPIPASLMPFPATALTSQPAAVTIPEVRQPSSAADEETAATTAITPPPPSSVTTLRRPETNDGVWIGFGQQKWISAGRPIPFASSEFVRVGQYADFPVFRRTGENEEVIYVPTRQGLVAPYRLKP